MGWASLQLGKAYLHVFILKKEIFSGTSSPNSITQQPASMGKKGILILQIKIQVVFKEKIITKMQKFRWGKVI
jgi:hypothetical protein